MAIGLLLNGEMFGIPQMNVKLQAMLHNPSLPFQGSGEENKPSNVVQATLEAKAVLVLETPRLFLHGSGEEFPAWTLLGEAPMETVWSTTAQSTLQQLERTKSNMHQPESAVLSMQQTETGIPMLANHDSGEEFPQCHRVIGTNGEFPHYHATSPIMVPEWNAGTRQPTVPQ